MELDEFDAPAVPTMPTVARTNKDAVTNRAFIPTLFSELFDIMLIHPSSGKIGARRRNDCRRSPMTYNIISLMLSITFGDSLEDFGTKITTLRTTAVPRTGGSIHEQSVTQA
jgi:hypothetical protein